MTSVRGVEIPGAADLGAALLAVRQHLQPTPLVPFDLAGNTVHLKLETFQPTGSFKVRGAIAAASRREAGDAVVTASAGNHGLAVAWATRRLGLRARIVVPQTVSPAKLAPLQAGEAEVCLHGGDFEAAEAHALDLAAGGAHYVSPYNDTDVISGSSTIGAELELTTDGPLLVVVPIGGGGLISGIGLWAKGRGDARVVGVEVAASRQMSTAVAAGGEVVEVPVGATVADGLAGNLEPGSITPRIVADAVEEICAVSEEELRVAMRTLALGAGVVAEGSGAAAFAALLAGHVVARPAETTVAIVSGRNVTAERLTEAMS